MAGFGRLAGIWEFHHGLIVSIRGSFLPQRGVELRAEQS